MLRIGSQKGEGKIGCLFWILVLMIVALAASRFVPVKIATMQLEDYMKELPMHHPRQTQSYYEREIANRARELKLEIPKEKIQVKKYTERVIMDIKFTVPLDFVIFQYDWNVQIYQDLDIFLI